MENFIPRVFIEHQEVQYIPSSCLCGCGSFERLFKLEEQEKNKNLRGCYRQFANGSHLKRYINLNKKCNIII